MNRLELITRTIKRRLGLSNASSKVQGFRPAYNLLLNILYGSRGLERRIRGQAPVRLHPRYRSISEEAEPEVFAALLSQASPGGVVLDVGANVGLFSLVLANRVGKKGRIFAFEPAPESLKALQKHIRLNHFADRIEAIGCAVSDHTGEATFYAHTFSGENTLNAAFARRVPNAGPVVVPITTIDAFCSARNIVPTLIKIDIEGFELHALRGAKQTLARHRPTVVVEMHPMDWPEIGVSRDRAAELLNHLCYRLTPLEGQTDPLSEYGHVVLEPNGPARATSS